VTDVVPAIYRTRIAHLRRVPLRHGFEHRGYTWYVDIDELPTLPGWLRPFARFDARDHFTGSASETLRDRVDRVLTQHGVDLSGGRVTALMQARVLGYVFNPLSLYWCHDADGRLQAVIAEVHNTYGDRHAYLLPPQQDQSVTVEKSMYVSPFNDVSGYYEVRAPRPAETLDVTINLHRDGDLVFESTMHGRRRAANPANIARIQFTAPLAPLVGALAIRAQGIALWLRRLPVVPRQKVHAP